MSNQVIESTLIAIFQRRAQVNFISNNNLANEKLLGLKICMPARELLLALFDIEKAFNIKIPEQAVIDGSFDTYNHIVKIVKEAFYRKYNADEETADAKKEPA